MNRVEFGVGTLFEPEENIIRLAKLAERVGYDFLWSGDVSQYDIYSMLTLFALQTKSIELGTCVTNLFTRIPAVIAAGIATVNRISKGRVVLGLGASSEDLLLPLGLKPKNVVRFYRESIKMMRTLWKGESPFDDAKVRYDEGTIDVEGYRLRFQTDSVPIYIAAAGPRMLELAGETADGVILDGLGGASRQFLSYALQHVTRGMEKQGRDSKDVDIVSWTRCSISEDGQAARDAIRPVIGRRISWEPSHTLRNVYDMPPDLIKSIKDAYRKVGRDPLRGKELPIKEAKQIISDELVDKFSITGTPADCVKRVRELTEAGATRIAIMCWPKFDSASDLTESRERAVKLFAETVVPEFRDKRGGVHHHS